MSAKITASRRAAFLKGLAETGNVTLSAERAKVSRRWAVLHRKRDADFDAACRAALAAADRARANAGMKPPSGWGHLDGVALVVRGSGGGCGRRGGRLVQIARARLHQWDPPTEDRFLATLAATCNVKAACAEVGMSAASAYAHRKRWRSFAERWDAAVEEGYTRIEIGLVHHGANLFSGEPLPTDTPIRAMTAEQAIHLLHMHKHQVHAIGRAPGLRMPGLRPPRPLYADVHASIARKAEAIKRAQGLSAEDRARDEETWALRRSAGEARRRG